MGAAARFIGWERFDILTFLAFITQEGAGGVLPPPGGAAIEASVISIIQWIRLLIEIIGALIITVGVAATVYHLVRQVRRPEDEDYNAIRLRLARFLALALEFQLGADILSTAIAPTWEQIGKLGAIAVIRTGLNYFLMREMREERRNYEEDEGKSPRSLQNSG